MLTAKSVSVSQGQKKVLEELCYRLTSPRRQVQRARIILLAASHVASKEISQRLGISLPTIRKWRNRWATSSYLLKEAEANGDKRHLEVVILKLLASKVPLNSPHELTTAQVKRIISLACGKAAGPCKVSRMSLPKLIDTITEEGIVDRMSPSVLKKVLEAHGIRPLHSSDEQYLKPRRRVKTSAGGG